MKMSLLACAFTIATAAACSPPAPPPQQDAPPAATEPPPFQLPTPTVTMEASPPPPFTYWAPEGATIRNHPNSEGVWQAFVDGKSVGFYFGDDCGASTRQHLVGTPVDAFPALPEGIELRTVCDTCAMQNDLRRNRLNVFYKEGTRVITRIECH